MSNKAWWDSDRSPRQYAEAILAMGDRERQRNFFDTHVPDHLKGMTMDHVKTALALGGNK